MKGTHMHTRPARARFALFSASLPARLSACLGALALLGSAAAQAQSVPTLSCTGSSAALTLQSGAGWTYQYGRNPPVTVTGTLTPHVNWTASPTGWIGSRTDPVPVNQNITYGVDFQVAPQVDRSSIRMNFSYAADDALLDIEVNGASVGASYPSPAFWAQQSHPNFAPAPAVGNPYRVRFLTYNWITPYALFARIDITADCLPAASVASVPANNPLALLTLGGTLLGAGALGLRRQTARTRQ